MLTRAQKQEQIEDLREKFGRATSVYLADYRGVNVEAVNRLRRRIRAEGGGDYEYRVAKNSVLKRAGADLAVGAVTGNLEGPTAIAISFRDPVGLAKILVDFAKDNEVFALKAGVVDGKPIDAAEIGTLATLPSLDQLRGKLVGLLLAPATKLARLVSEPGAQMARVLAARGRQES